MADLAGKEGWLVGPAADAIHFSLWVVGDDLDPDEVTRLLDAEPSRAHRKGESRAGPPGAGREAVGARTGVWLLTLPASTDWTLVDGLEALLARLPADPAVWDRLADRFAVTIVCALFFTGDWMRGAVLPPALLGELAARRITLSFDLLYITKKQASRAGRSSRAD